jgi:D-glycero-alpha-D-manno-heptose-7-phosphate kinase
MIITRSPLRITLGGGGTDLPSYYRQHGGFLIAAAIDKHVYVTVTRPFTPGIYLKYSQLEHVDSGDEVRHPIIREAIRLIGMKPQVEITTLADIPAGTGLGSSGSFTTALLRALYAFERRLIGRSELAELASDIEMRRLGEPTGKQDPYAAAFGGLTAFTFHPGEQVDARPLKMPAGTMYDLEDDLLLFFTGFSRKAGSILQDQKARTESNDSDMLSQLHYVKELGLRTLQVLESGKTLELGELLHEHWEQKRRRSEGMTNPQIDEWYDLGRRNGAVGGKLVGAGGGGFLMFYAENHRRLREAMTNAGLEEVRFRFSFEGTKVLFD